MTRKIVIPDRPRVANDVDRPVRERRTLGLRYGAEAEAGSDTERA